MKKHNIRNMVQIAILGTMANVLLLVRFPLPFMPPFMDFDLSGVPEMAGAFLMGPAAGVLVAFIKIVLKLITSGTSSMFTGELQNLIVSSAYVLPAGIIYKRMKTKKGALVGIIVGTLVCTVVAVFSNMYIIIPFYAKAYNLNMEQIIEMTQAVNRFVDSELKFIVLGVVPFNLIKGGVTSMIIHSIYPILMRIIQKESNHAV